jgi:hypothetical protein
MARDRFFIMMGIHMALILIHPEYQKGGSLCPVCNVKTGFIPRNNFRLCPDCNKAVIENNHVMETMHSERTNYLSRCFVQLGFGMTMILFDIVYVLHHMFRIIRDSADVLRRHPWGNMKNNVGQGRGNADLYVCKI